ncbi:uncharacterized protein B0I36DRAFT_350577 [Microdochium trichocladiopsis]|uniref:Uncharacterized protein n=1 Tax=Microdochium trichocladiopsis TaxID=1682393 RepID=A0A9P8Y7E5_9PEZI|nr:uncharacterized protein B0I36DRAFT_350577 [Microdochium trichocladiopsis]KAH7029758.1 hypothetical protein B0I36DRAFT_350577 [Microdochium trichocladiopsis]
MASKIVRDSPPLETTMGSYKVMLDEVDNLLEASPGKGSDNFYEQRDTFNVYDARLIYIGLNSHLLISTGGLGAVFSYGCTLLLPSRDAWPSTASRCAAARACPAAGAPFAFPSEITDTNSVGLSSLYWQAQQAQNGDCSYNPKKDDSNTFGISLAAVPTSP